MAQLRSNYKKFMEKGARIVVLGPENAKAFEKYWQENDLPFIGIPDPTGIVLKAFGQEVNLFKLGRMPAQVLVDKHGVALFAHYGHSMADIPDPEDVLSSL